MKKNTQIFFQIVAFTGAISSFMPWFMTLNDSAISGVDLQGIGVFFDFDFSWIILLFPISFLLSGLLKLKASKGIPNKVIKAIELIPIFFALTLIIRLFYLLQYGHFQIIPAVGFFNLFKTGSYIVLICSILLVFAPARLRD